MSVDARRLARAVHLDAERLPDGRWRVSGGRGAHTVTHGRCDCTDTLMRRAGPCKHVLAVRLRLADPDVLAALREIVPRPSRAR